MQCNSLYIAFRLLNTNDLKLSKMNTTIISLENKLQDILNFDACKEFVKVAKANNETCAILCPHYSINIASKFEDGEALQYDLDELGEYLGGYFVEVSDYDDLVINFNNED